MKITETELRNIVREELRGMSRSGSIEFQFPRTEIPDVDQALKNTGLDKDYFISKHKGIARERPYSHYVRIEGTAAYDSAEKLERELNSLRVDYQKETLR